MVIRSSLTRKHTLLRDTFFNTALSLFLPSLLHPPRFRFVCYLLTFLWSEVAHCWVPMVWTLGRSRDRPSRRRDHRKNGPYTPSSRTHFPACVDLNHQSWTQLHALCTPDIMDIMKHIIQNKKYNEMTNLTDKNHRWNNLDEIQKKVTQWDHIE